ncbi:MAG: hypothetical protein WCA57_10250, partial [Ilumatobacteraceae bacterium]
HGSTDSVERSIPDAPSYCICGGLSTLAGLSDLSGEFFEVSVCLSECILALQLCAERNLQEFRGWEIALLQLFMEVFGQVHLDTGHTPNHTPTSRTYQQAVWVPPTARERHGGALRSARHCSLDGHNRLGTFGHLSGPGLSVARASWLRNISLWSG